MLCRSPIAVLIVLASSQAMQAATLKGVVLLNGTDGSGVANVKVSAVDGANRTETDPDGRFALEFPEKRVGEAVRLIVAKEGYEVVNDVQLEQLLPANAGAEPLIVIVCRKGNREEMARRFYRLRSFDAIEVAYRKRLQELEKTKQATTAELEKLRQERDQARDAASKTSEELAKDQPGKTSELYREAMRYFLNGNIEQAVSVLDDEKLRRMLSAARKRKAEAETAIAELTQAWTIKAQFLTLQFRFAEAEQAHKAAIEASPDSFDPNFAYGVFNQGLIRLDKAIEVYNRCLALAKKSRNEPHIAETLNNLGIVHRYQNRMGEAREAFEEALKSFRELARQNPDTYLTSLAGTLNNVGILDHDQNRMEEAREAFEEALKIRRELARNNPDTYLPDVARTLSNLGNLDREQNRMEEARQALEEALKIRRELAQKNPDTYLPDVASTLNNLGNLDRAQKRMGEARQTFEEALKSYRELARKNPDTYLPGVAMTLHNLGNLYLDQNRMEEARQVFEEALKIRRELARRNPDTYLPDVAMTLNSLGILDRDQNRMEESRQAHEEALKSYRELARKNPDTYLPGVAMTLHNLGNLYLEQNRMEEARQALEEALKISRELARRNPDTYLPYVAMTLNSLGGLDRAQNRMREARQAFEEALGIYQSFAERDPEQFRAHVGRVESLLKELPQ